MFCFRMLDLAKRAGLNYTSLRKEDDGEFVKLNDISSAYLQNDGVDISWISKAGWTCIATLLVTVFFIGCTGAQQQSAEQETIPEVTVAQPQEKAQPDKKDFLIAIDLGHQSREIDMSATEPNAVMKAKATTGTMGTFSGTYEYDLNLDISLRL